MNLLSQQTWRLALGRCEDGAIWRLRLLGTHVLVAGATGSGKGSVFGSLMRALGPRIKDGSVQIWAVDPKGGMELQPSSAIFARFAYESPEAMIRLLEDAVSFMRFRAERLRLEGQRVHTPALGVAGGSRRTPARSGGADRESKRGGQRVHPEQVAAYLAKYLTKTTEEFGLTGSVRSAEHARLIGATPHVVRIVETAQRLAREGAEYARLGERLSTLGYRGHPITKSRRYSVTFGHIRRARRLFRSRPATLDPEADIREVLDDEAPEGFEVVSSFVYVGRGYLSFHEAAEAVRSAALARAH